MSELTCKRASVRTCEGVRMCVHECMCACVRAYVQASERASVFACKRACVYASMRAEELVILRGCTCARMRASICACAHECMHDLTILVFHGFFHVLEPIQALVAWIKVNAVAVNIERMHVVRDLILAWTCA